MSDFPKIVPHFLSDFLKSAKRMEGKTIEKIEYGHEDAGGSEALILQFTDGTKVGITLGSDADNPQNPKEIMYDLTFHWNDE